MTSERLIRFSAVLAAPACQVRTGTKRAGLQLAATTIELQSVAIVLLWLGFRLPEPFYLVLSSCL
jgi:hypothetical protein